MNVLLTGGCGYIGSHTCIEMLNAGHNVVVVDNHSNSNPEALKRVREITGKDVKEYDFDLCDYDKILNLLWDEQINCVVHFAGYKAVGESVKFPLKYYGNNLISTINLLQAMEEAECRRIVFSSSATVYGEKNPSPLDETMELGDTTNPYGTTKAMIERILFDLCASHPKWSATLLRYFNPVGAHPSGKIGEDPNGIPNNLMPYISQVAIGKRPHLNVFGDDYDTADGTGVRDFIHVVDLARGHVKAVDYAMGHRGAEVFNLGTGCGYSVLEMLHAFEKACGHEIPYEIQARRSGDLAEVFSNPAKAKEILGWEAEYGIEEMCRDAWNWQSNNPNGYKDAK